MSDITKCHGLSCPIKEKCHRFTARESMMQSYFVVVPAKYDSDEKFIGCDMFWGDGQDQIMETLTKIVTEK